MVDVFIWREMYIASKKILLLLGLFYLVYAIISTKMESNQPANSINVQEETTTQDVILPSMEQSLMSLEKLDRDSPDLWPTQIPGVSEFATLQITGDTPSWNTGITSADIPYVTKLGSLPTFVLIQEVKKLHDLAYQLGLDEANEMTRGKYLNIFKSRKQR